MIPLALVGCGSAKLDRVAPARELYTGSLFRAVRDDVEARGLRWGVASAKHAFLHPDQEIAPYDYTIRANDLEAVACWADDVAFGLWSLLRALGEPCVAGVHWRSDAVGTVELHMGERYAAPIRVALARRVPGLVIEEPARGLEIGQRLAFYAARRHTRAHNARPHNAQLSLTWAAK